VKVEMASPGFVLNDLVQMKNSAVFAWGMYAGKFQGVLKYHELVNWKDMGYGTQVPYYVLVVRKDIIAKHPHIVQTVVQLNYDATKKALTVGDYKAPELALYNAFKKKYMGAVPSPTPALVLPDAQANPTYLHDVVDYMTKCDYFKVPYTYTDLVNETFYAKIKK
jgi:ABC-type nitrate/sulfonate/bicarbonate transport system substrate-binding protein